MKRLILAATVLALVALPAMAQNAGQIARVRGGASCSGCNLFQGDFSGLEARGLNLSGSRLRQADLSLSRGLQFLGRHAQRNQLFRRPDGSRHGPDPGPVEPGLWRRLDDPARKPAHSRLLKDLILTAI